MDVKKKEANLSVLVQTDTIEELKYIIFTI